MDRIVIEGGPHDGAEYEVKSSLAILILLHIPKLFYGLDRPDAKVWECQYRRTERKANDSRKTVFVYAGATELDPGNFPSYDEYKRTEGSGPSTSA